MNHTRRLTTRKSRHQELDPKLVHPGASNEQIIELMHLDIDLLDGDRLRQLYVVADKLGQDQRYDDAIRFIAAADGSLAG